jgi:hypothetical protein
MPEYRPRPTARWCEALEMEVVEPRPVTVIETDDGVPTGVLDAEGREFYRYVKGRMGFLDGD